MFAETRPLVLLAFVLGGLVSGALANVVIHRDRARVPLYRGRAICPDCGEPSPFYERLPVVSYLIGSGRRRRCGHEIRVRDPLVEVVSAVAWGLVAARVGLTAILPALLVFATTLVVVSAVDLDERRIPNKVLAPAGLVAAVLLAAAALAAGEPGLIVRMLIGGLGYAVPMFILGVVAPGSMGMGDVKLAAYLGAHLAWFSGSHVLVGAFLGFLLGAVLGLALIAVKKKDRKDTLPFGPSMALGAFVVLFIGGIPALFSP
ncbi:MAG TPA: A24 family peptidase [Actinomycetota bacterium]|nr:A24 family peptidase [Actinomycetota bacterium]